MPQPKQGELTERQLKFCEEYISNGFNALQAYYAAFPDASKKNKPSYPYTLLKTPQVKEYIQNRRQEIYESLNIDAIRIAQELADMAFASKDDQIYVPTVKLRALEQLSKNLGLQSQKIESKETVEVSLVEDEEDG